MRFLAASLLIALATFTAFGQDPTQRLAQSRQTASPAEVNLELTQTANAYRAGNFAEAQRHAERAVSLDPASVTAATFLARVLHQRYKPGDDTSENLDMARAAITAYQRLMTLDSQNEEAYKAIAVLYSSTHQEESLREWIFQRAANPQISNEKRAEAYAVLAGKYWDCSYKVTELPDNKTVEIKGNNANLVFKKPKDALEFERIKQCVSSGLEMADLAIALDQNSESAWSYKTNLLMENAKLAEMDGMDLEKARYLKESNQAQVRTSKLADERRRKEEKGSLEPQGLPVGPRPLPPPRVPKPLS